MDFDGTLDHFSAAFRRAARARTSGWRAGGDFSTADPVQPAVTRSAVVDLTVVLPFLDDYACLVSSYCCWGREVRVTVSDECS